MLIRTACRSLAVASALLLLLAPLDRVEAEADATSSGSPTVKGEQVSPAMAKVSSHLRAARNLLRQGESRAALRPGVASSSMKSGRLEVEVRLDALDPGLLGQLQAAGLDVTYSSTRHARVVGRLDPSDLERVASIPEVATIHPLYGYRTWTGSVDNQADASIRADTARMEFGVDGLNVEIGVISDSFNDTIGGSVSGSDCNASLTGSDPQVSGDLPGSIRLLDNGSGGGTDEGAAMAELIYDVAPHSEFAFHNAGPGSGEAGFADAIDELRGCGADIIVDDVLFFAEPMFQDGPVAQAARAAVDAGVPYYSSAGNAATFGVDETYTDSGGTDDSTFGDDFHDFGGGDRFAELTVPAGCGFFAALQWNDPFDGTLGPGASNDLDLYTCTSEDPADCVFGSTDSQGCSLVGGGPGGDPLEVQSFNNNTGGAATVHLAVDHFCGDETARFRIAVFATGCSINDFTFEAGIFDQPQIYGHAVAEGVQAVAAAFYGEIDDDGDLEPPLGQIDVEAFSSLGGDLPFYFDDAGNPLAGAPVTRFQPGITGPDGSNTTFFGSDIALDMDSDPNFFGTSAAAAHAAAVAALVKEAAPNLEPNGINQVLAASARDIETAGVDDLSGHGLIDAFDAVQTVSAIGNDCIDNLALSDQDVTGTQFFRACQSITAGDDYNVAAGANLTFRAGDSITLQTGFSVETGAGFNAVIDPSLASTGP